MPRSALQHLGFVQKNPPRSRDEPRAAGTEERNEGKGERRNEGKGERRNEGMEERRNEGMLL